MIDKSLLYRVAIGIFAIHLSVASGLFLIGEVVLGVDYMIRPNTLSIVIYGFVSIKFISQFLIVISAINEKLLKHKNIIFLMISITIALCIFYVLYSGVQTNNEVLFSMKIDALKNIAFFIVYMLSVNSVLGTNKESDVI